MPTTYKITLLNNLKALFPISFWAVPLILGCVFLVTDAKSVVIIVLATSLLWGLVVFIHLEYLKLNWGAICSVDKANGLLTYRDQNNEVTVPFHRISKVVKHGPPDMAFLRDAYFYYEVLLKNRESIILTCLMVRDLEIPGIEMDKAINAVPSIYLSKDKAV